MQEDNQPAHNRSRFLRVTSLLVLLVLVGARCGVGPTAPAGIADPFPKEKLTLEIWRPYNEETAFQDVITNYQSQHPNVSFHFRFIEQTNFETELLNALANNQGPDIVSLPNDAIPQFADKLVAMPDAFYSDANLIANVSTKYAPAVTTDVIQEQKVYGIPFYTDTLALYWNRDIFQKKFQQFIREERSFNQDLLIRAPVDWNEVVELTKLITEHGDQTTLSLSAIALGEPRNTPLTSDIIAALLLQQGAQMVTSDHRAAAFHLPSTTDPTFYPGEAALEFLRGFSDPASAYYTWNADQPDAVQAFIDGKVAMMINYQSISPYLKQRNPNLKFATAPLPQIANTRIIVDYAKYQVEAVTNQSKHALVAWDFLRFMTTSGLGLYANLTQRPNPLRNNPATTTTAERAFSNTPFIVQIATAQSWHKGRDPQSADKILSRSLEKVVAGTPPRTSLIESANDLTALLRT